VSVRVYSKEERRLRKQMALLISSVRLFEAQIDVLFHPASPVQGVDRGKKLAAHLNDLALENDRALYFGLGFDYRKDAKDKRRDGTNIKAIIKHGSQTKEIKP
jgi:hypothetical protein